MARGTCNIETLSGELTAVSGSEWFKLGTQLGVEDFTLRDIEANHRGDVQRCKREMLRIWLQSGPKNPWETLAAALESIGKKVLAQGILQLGKCNTILPQKVKGNYNLPQAINVKDLLDPSDPDSRRYVHDRCQTDKLDEEALTNYTIFAIEVTKLLRQQKIDVDDLILAWSYLYVDKNTEVPRAICEANNITSFVQALRQHQTWFNYGGLKFLAAHFGGEEGKKLVASYEGRLKDNVKQRVKAQKVPKKASKLVVKFDWKKYSKQDIFNFRNMLARVLKRDAHEFVLKTVRQGCVELVYIIPSDLCESIRSLSGTVDLEEYEVMAVTVNGELIWSKSGNRQALADPEAMVVPDSKRIKLTFEGEGSVVSTGWKSHPGKAINKGGSRQPLRTRGVKLPDKETSPQSRHWLRSALVVLVRVMIAVVSVLLLVTGIAVLFWAGQKSYATGHIMIGGFCFVLGCICCFYFWRRKLFRR